MRYQNRSCAVKHGYDIINKLSTNLVNTDKREEEYDLKKCITTIFGQEDKHNSDFDAIEVIEDYHSGHTNITSTINGVVATNSGADAKRCVPTMSLSNIFKEGKLKIIERNTYLK